MAKTVTLRLDEETYRIFVEAAKADGKSLANLIQRAALLRIQEEQFVDDDERIVFMTAASHRGSAC